MGLSTHYTDMIYCACNTVQALLSIINVTDIFIIMIFLVFYTELLKV